MPEGARALGGPIMQLPRPPRAPQTIPSKTALATLFVSSLIIFAPHFTRLPIWMSLFCACFVLWRITLLRLNRKVPSSMIRVVLTIVMISLVILQFQTIFGRTAGSALLLVFAGLKILESKDLRDAMFCNCLFMVVVLSAFLFDQSPVTATYGLVSLIIIVSNFNMLIAPKEFAFLRAAKLTGLILLHGLPLTLATYMLFPRIDGSLWGIVKEPTTGSSGLSDQMSPGDINKLSLNDAVAFRVDFKGSAPLGKDMYWRVLVMNQFDGKSWKPQSPNYFRNHKVTKQQEETNYFYSVTLEPSNQTYLPLLDLPVHLESQGRIAADGTGSSNKKIRKRIAYDAQSILAARLTTPPIEDDRYLPSRLKAETLELGRRFADEEVNGLDIARRILKMFRTEEFYYTLEPPLLNSTPVSDFLFRSRRGYCEHYASAFSTVMRAAGIPARVVLGYQGGEYNSNGDYHIFRQSDAHAWSEIWIENKGWIRIDPTSAVAPERIDYGMDALRRLEADGYTSRSNVEIGEYLKLTWFEQNIEHLSMIGDTFTHRWNKWIMAYGPAQQREFLQSLGIKAPDWGWMTLTLSLLLVIFLIVSYLIIRRPGQLPESPLKYYRIFQQKLLKHQQQLNQGEGAIDFSRRMAQNFPAKKDEIQEIGELYTTLRYGSKYDKKLFHQLRKRVRSFSLK